MTQIDPTTLFERLVSLNRTLRGTFEERSRRLGLTFARARLLATIGRNPGATQTQLAALMDIETPTLKRLLDAIEQQGLAERRPLPEDARKYAVHLRDISRVEPILHFRTQIEATLTEGIDPADMEVTSRVLAQMAENAERLRRG